MNQPELSMDGVVHHILWPEDEVEMRCRNEPHNPELKYDLEPHYKDKDGRWKNCLPFSTDHNAAAKAKERLKKMGHWIQSDSGRGFENVRIMAGQTDRILGQGSADTESRALCEAIIAMGEARKGEVK